MRFYLLYAYVGYKVVDPRSSIVNGKFFDVDNLKPILLLQEG